MSAENQIEGGFRHAVVPKMVAVQAAAAPNALAVADSRDALTYSDLDRRSNQLARYLQSLGVGADRLVGLCAGRSPSMVVAALAVLKAGGAYVPLDSTLPAERLDFMIRDADVQVLIAEGAPAAKLPQGSWHLVDFQERADEIASFSSEAFPCSVTPDNLAYVIYTSGSTGQPKGVEITHGGLANLVAWHRRAFQITPQDRATQQAAVGFDAAVWEIWPYLAAGASVHIVPETCRANPEALRDWLVAERITVTFLATPLAERMLSLPWPDHTALRILLTGADTLHRRPAPGLPFALVNNYGPTECTVVATSGTVAPGPSSQPPSIGAPIDNIQVHIVDEKLQEVPTGIAGELCIAGAGLACGYRRRPDLTAEKFIPNPFSSNPGDRLYRTGDLARYLPSGEIEFLGRLDEQIKIRGFRIEPNEIVRALDEHAEVQASAVVARDRGAGEKSLVAYVVASPSVTVTALREHLGKRLPEYMVPSTFVRMESLPITANGKIDRAVLPAPTDTNRLLEDNFVAPCGPVQERLAAIISALLHVDRIGANDNFFLLGGHSLLGTQLLARVSEAFGVELPLLQLFDHPTLSEMSDAIETLILAKLEPAGAVEAHRLHAD
jgi:amino acid adenylation domain-containing protein